MGGFFFMSEERFGGATAVIHAKVPAALCTTAFAPSVQTLAG